MNGGVEVVTDARAVQVNRNCHKDGCHGLMITTGTGRGGTFGIRWTHQCNVCKGAAEFEKQYPCFEVRAGTPSPQLGGYPI